MQVNVVIVSKFSSLSMALKIWLVIPVRVTQRRTGPRPSSNFQGETFTPVQFEISWATPLRPQGSPYRDLHQRVGKRVHKVRPRAPEPVSRRTASPSPFHCSNVIRASSEEDERRLPCLRAAVARQLQLHRFRGRRELSFRHQE